MLANGFDYIGVNYHFDVRHYVMDAEARQLVKFIRNHNHRHGCEKCVVVGIRYRHRTLFLPLDAERRTDASFTARRDAEHHNADSIENLTPLEEQVNTGMVSQFRLDPLHAVDIGVFLRWLKFLLGKYGPYPFVLSCAEKARVSELIDELAPYMPSEFARRPRNLKYFATYKAAELRRMTV